MIVKFGDITYKDFTQIRERQFIRKTPYEITLILRTKVFHQQVRVGDTIEITYNDGKKTSSNVLLESTQIGEFTHLTTCHISLFKIMRNKVMQGEYVLDIQLTQLISYDWQSHDYLLEELGRRGLVYVVNSNLDGIDKVSITDWENRDIKRIRGIYRKTDVNLTLNDSVYRQYSLQNREDEDVATLRGVGREILNYSFTRTDLKGLDKRIEPMVTVIGVGLNEHIRVLDKIKYGDTEYCVMGIQRVNKDNKQISVFTLGLTI